MAQTVVAFFRTLRKAEDVTLALSAEGVPPEAVKVMTGDLPAAPDLIEAGIPPEEVAEFENAMQRGAVLVLAIVDDNIAERVAAVMDSQGAHSVEDIAASSEPIATIPPEAPPAREAPPVRETPPAREAPPPEAPLAREAPPVREMQPSGETPPPRLESSPSVPQPPAADLEEPDRLPSRVELGRVRVATSIDDEPVERTVNLREERIDIERRSVERKATDADLAAFEEGTLEFIETVERVVTRVTPVVVEEVVVRRKASEREETVRETLRKGQVSIERLRSDDESQRFAG